VTTGVPAKVVHVVVVGVADRPGERAQELEVGAPLERGELEPPFLGRPVVGLLVLVLDVEHPRGDGPPATRVVPWITR
jgi:hypothetical protein